MSTEDEIGHNSRMRADKLRRKMTRQHAWVNQVAAQTEQRRRAANDELVGLGLDPIDYDQLHLEDAPDELLAELASRTLPDE